MVARSRERSEGAGRGALNGPKIAEIDRNIRSAVYRREMSMPTAIAALACGLLTIAGCVSSPESDSGVSQASTWSQTWNHPFDFRGYASHPDSLIELRAWPGGSGTRVLAQCGRRTFQ